MELFPVFALMAIILIDNSISTRDRNRGNNRHTSRVTQNEPEEDNQRPTFQCASDRPTCQNFDVLVNTMINRQINVELNASYTYQSMAVYFNRDDVALRGFAKFFHKASDEEREHAQKLMDYLNKRGGNMELFNVSKPATDSWGTGLDAMSTALVLERVVNDHLLDLHYVGGQRNDPHLTNFLESEYLTEQVDSIKQLSDYVRVLTRLGSQPLGEIIFDQELYEGKR